jgi:hypothetical protein
MNCGTSLVQTQSPSLPVKSSKGLGQVFGLDPRIAFLTFLVDAMLFGGAFPTGLFIALLSIPAGAVLGFITYRAQLAWYGDDQESAMIKGCIVGLLTAIPVGIPAIRTASSGLVGFLHNAGKKDPGK